MQYMAGRSFLHPRTTGFNLGVEFICKSSCILDWNLALGDAPVLRSGSCYGILYMVYQDDYIAMISKLSRKLPGAVRV